MSEKKILKKVDNNIFVVSSHNESQVPSKIAKFWAVLEMKFYLKRFRMGLKSFLFRNCLLWLCVESPLFTRHLLVSWQFFYGSPRLAGLLRRNQHDCYNTFFQMILTLL